MLRLIYFPMILLSCACILWIRGQKSTSWLLCCYVDTVSGALSNNSSYICPTIGTYLNIFHLKKIDWGKLSPEKMDLTWQMPIIPAWIHLRIRFLVRIVRQYAKARRQVFLTIQIYETFRYIYSNMLLEKLWPTISSVFQKSQNIIGSCSPNYVSIQTCIAWSDSSVLFHLCPRKSDWVWTYPSTASYRQRLIYFTTRAYPPIRRSLRL